MIEELVAAGGGWGLFSGCAARQGSWKHCGARAPCDAAATGEARTDKGRMPKAVVPAARRALESAGIAISDLATVKTHNPFAVNDVYFSKETGFPLDRMNRYGSALVYGHPQAPTGCRGMIEMIEELVAAGGGWGLFSGCAAGDTAMAVVLRVG